MLLTYHILQYSYKYHVYPVNTASNNLLDLFDSIDSINNSHQGSGGFLYEREVLLHNGHQKATCAESRGENLQFNTFESRHNIFACVYRDEVISNLVYWRKPQI